jgi:hypothetical protein
LSLQYLREYIFVMNVVPDPQSVYRWGTERKIITYTKAH